MNDPDTWEPLKGSCGLAEAAASQQRVGADDLVGSATQAPLTLDFKDKALESRFRAWYDDAATAHDLQAASIYLWMVALGSLLYLAVIAYSPASRPANVDQCTALILCSWVGPITHLLLLRLLPRATYSAHRTAIILAFRATYVGVTSVNGFGLCGVGPLQGKKGAVAAALQGVAPFGYLGDLQGATVAAAAADGLMAAAGWEGIGAAAADSISGRQQQRCALESPYSAVMWRSGVIGLIWWQAAFPLPLSHHVPLQAASTALYIATLAPTVCGTLQGVRAGPGVLAAIRMVGDAFASQLLSVMGVSVRHGGGTASAAAAAAAAAAGSSDGCVHVLAYVQVVLGLVLPAFVMYCFEARKRHSWWHDLHSSSGSGNNTSAGNNTSGNNTSGGGNSGSSNASLSDDGVDGSSGGGCSQGNLATLEEAAVAAMAAASDGWDVGLGVYHLKKAQPTQQAAAAAKGGGAAGVAAGVTSNAAAGRSHSRTAEGRGGSSSSSRAGSSSSGSRADSVLSNTSSIGSREGSSSSSSMRASLSAGALSSLQQQKGGSVKEEPIGIPTAPPGGAGSCGVNEAALLAAVDSWEGGAGGSGAHQPPGWSDLFVLLVVLGLSWVALGQLLP